METPFEGLQNSSHHKRQPQQQPQQQQHLSAGLGLNYSAVQVGGPRTPPSELGRRAMPPAASRRRLLSDGMGGGPLFANLAFGFTQVSDLWG